MELYVTENNTNQRGDHCSSLKRRTCKSSPTCETHRVLLTCTPPPQHAGAGYSHETENAEHCVSNQAHRISSPYSSTTAAVQLLCRFSKGKLKLQRNTHGYIRLFAIEPGGNTLNSLGESAGEHRKTQDNTADKGTITKSLRCCVQPRTSRSASRRCASRRRVSIIFARVRLFSCLSLSLGPLHPAEIATSTANLCCVVVCAVSAASPLLGGRKMGESYTQ